MNLFQRVVVGVLVAPMALACNEQSMTEESAGNDLNGLRPSFLITDDALTIGFEAFEREPWYVLGTIHGQDDWSSSGPYDHAVAPNTHYSSFGEQSLRISNAMTSGAFGDQTYSRRIPNYAGESTSDCGVWCLPAGTRRNHFEAEWDFAPADPGAEQPNLSVVASPDRGDGARMSWVQMTDNQNGLEVNFFEVREQRAQSTSWGRSTSPPASAEPCPTRSGSRWIYSKVRATMSSRYT